MVWGFGVEHLGVLDLGRGLWSLLGLGARALGCRV